MTTALLHGTTAPPGREYWFPPARQAPPTACDTSLRTRSLAHTEALAAASLDRCGITRIADVTALDVLGIPVFHSMRPAAAPGLNTITSGKGATRQAAKVSAMMEAIERTWCEPPADGIPDRASLNELRKAGVPALDPRKLILRRGTAWTPDTPLAWWPTRELGTDVEVLVPALAVFTPFPDDHDMFMSNTIGLASGNSPQEALLHGLLEAVEQDCTAFGETLKGGRRIRLESLPPGPAELVERFLRWGVETQVYGYTNEIGVPTVFVTTDDTNAADGLLINGGAGCHPDPVVATNRALTEAAQSRLAVISGAREDLNSQAYRRHASYEAMREMLHTWRSGRSEMDFGELPSVTTRTTDGDLDRVLAGLRGVGLDLTLAVEMAPPGLPFSVTKVIVPGLETYHNDTRRLGIRLHREMVRAGVARELP